MESSILTSTKKVLGIAEAYTAYDLDILTHINSTFATLAQLGVGPAEGFFIEDASTGWDEYPVPADQLNMVRSYVFLKVRMVFDPPTTSFVLDSHDRQIKEFEWRLNVAREEALP